MARGALTYAADHQNGTLTADHAVKLPRVESQKKNKEGTAGDFSLQTETNVNPKVTWLGHNRFVVF